MVDPKSYDTEAIKCLAGFQLLEHLLKQYIGLHHLTARHLLRGSLPFNFDGKDVQKSSLDGLIGRFRKCTDDLELVSLIVRVKNKRDDIAHLAFARTYLGLSEPEKATAIEDFLATRNSIVEICQRLEGVILSLMVAPYRHAFEPWARSQPLVRRIWVFGSRARGDHRLESDLDIAIELDMDSAAGVDASGGMATWIFETKDWKTQLDALSGLDVDLEHFLGDDTPVIRDALERSSALIYEKR